MQKSFQKNLKTLAAIIGIYGGAALLNNCVSYNIQLNRLDGVKDELGLEESIKKAQWELDYHSKRQFNEYTPILFFWGHFGDIKACESFIKKYHNK